MTFSPKSFSSPIGLIIAFVWIWTSMIWLKTGYGAASLNPDVAKSVAEQHITISIKSREFNPGTVSLNAGRQTRLVVKNLDSELHAFLPVGLLSGTHLNVSGNGAPQFGAEGLLRVLLPSNGQTEIVFTPTKIGTFTYFCDLPGHVMRGTIVVHQNEGVLE